MIITIYGIIVFQLVERIAYIKKTAKTANLRGTNTALFPRVAIRTRHEIPRKPYP